MRVLYILGCDLFGPLAELGLPRLLHLLLDHFVWVLGVALALDLVEKVPLVLEEEHVPEHQLFGFFPFGFVEIVHVELTDEAAQVTVLEELGKHVVAEVVLVMDHKGFAAIGPGDGGVGGVAVYNLV
jgi:hypothetical protein